RAPAVRAGARDRLRGRPPARAALLEDRLRFRRRHLRGDDPEVEGGHGLPREREDRADGREPLRVPGREPRPRLVLHRLPAHPRELDRAALADVSQRAGVSDPLAAVLWVVRGVSPRSVLAPLAERLSTLDDARLVDEAYRALLGQAPDEAGRSFHLANLSAD